MQSRHIHARFKAQCACITIWCKVRRGPACECLQNRPSGVLFLSLYWLAYDINIARSSAVAVDAVSALGQELKRLLPARLT